ncbi:hypothetical protein ACFV19_00310 [Streptomyces griseoluteus]
MRTVSVLRMLVGEVGARYESGGGKTIWAEADTPGKRDGDEAGG